MLCLDSEIIIFLVTFIYYNISLDDNPFYTQELFAEKGLLDKIFELYKNSSENVQKNCLHLISGLFKSGDFNGKTTLINSGVFEFYIEILKDLNDESK